MGGYLVAGGALAGFSIGAFLLFNRAVFSSLVRISQFEATSYFLGVFMPAFVILIIAGYLFATSARLRSSSLSALTPFVVLGFLCVVFSALSVFYLISFIGGCLVLAALIKAYTKPAFQVLSRKEAFFFLEVGTVFSASFSVLLLLNWLVSSFYETYSLGVYKSLSPYSFVFVGAISLFAFFAVPLVGAQGRNYGLCLAFGLATSLPSVLVAVQSQYVLFSTSAYAAASILIVGVSSVLIGSIAYARLLLSRFAVPTAASLTSTLLYFGKYCPYCGRQRSAAFQTWCPHCGRNLMWTPSAPYCPSCGRVLPPEAQKCPHCLEDIEKKRVYYLQKEAKDQAIADKLLDETRKKKLKSIKTG